MPSKDPVNAKANAWLSSDQAKRRETGAREPGAAASPIGRRALSGQVVRLAKRLGKTPEEIAETIPEDTLRRTKFPVIEVLNEDGTRTYKHDEGVSEGVLPLARR